MPFEITTYLGVDIEPGALLDLLVRTAPFDREGDSAIGLGSIAEADISDGAEQEMVFDALGFRPKASLRFIIQEEEPEDADAQITVLGARLVLECGGDGAVTYASGMVAVRIINRKVALASELVSLEPTLSEVFGGDVSVVDLGTL